MGLFLFGFFGGAAVEFGAADGDAGVVEPFHELFGVAAFVDHVGGVDDALGVEVPEVVVQELHAELFTGLDRRVDAVGFVLADHVGDGGGDEHELVGGDDA